MPRTNRMDLASLLGTLSGLMNQGVPGRLWAQVQPWVSNFLEQATVRWGTHMLEDRRCELPRCRHQSVTECEACGAAVCLPHAWVGQDAGALCELCVTDLLGRSPKHQDGRRAPPKPPKEAAGGTRGRRAARDPDRARALAELGLRGDATWDEIQQKFRELTLVWHPDKHPHPVDKRDAEEKFKRITEAYELLKARRAAA